MLNEKGIYFILLELDKKTRTLKWWSEPEINQTTANPTEAAAAAAAVVVCCCCVVYTFLDEVNQFYGMHSTMLDTLPWWEVLLRSSCTSNTLSNELQSIVLAIYLKI